MKHRIAILSALLLIVVVAFIFFHRYISHTVYTNSAGFLEETARLYAGTFKVKMNDQLFMLESQARYFTDIDMGDYNKIKQTIMSTKGVGEFKRIAVANASGMTINYDGKSSGNILMNDYFRRAMQGTPTVSSNISFDEDGERVLTFAVPIFQGENHVAGVITGTFAYAILDNIFAVDTFSGNGYSFLVDNTGHVLVGSKSTERLCFSENWLSFMDAQRALSSIEINSIKNDMRANRTGNVHYSINDEERILVYTPVNMNDWYVLSAVTADYLTIQQRKITLMALALILVVLAAFTGFFLVSFYLIRQNEKIEKDNARYAVSTQNSQTLIYEYDFENKLIEFTGNSAPLFGKNLRKFPIADFSVIEKRIHESERNFLSRVKAFIASGKTKYASELRLLDETGRYIWYRVSFMLVFDKESKPVKLIGSIVNVNEQIVHEQQLKEMAETDLLSGLLNKTFMEKHVNEFMQAHNDIIGAFYMIDLDNFKQVNDRIGHSAGDTAICDAANKLTLVFTEKDFIGRIGGDEFCVFLALPSSMQQEKIDEIITEKAQILKNVLHETYVASDDFVSVTPSIGIALYPLHAKSYRQLFKKADAAMYHVKEHGKNGFAVFDESTMKEAGESIYG